MPETPPQSPSVINSNHDAIDLFEEFDNPRRLVLFLGFLALVVVVLLIVVSHPDQMMGLSSGTNLLILCWALLIAFMVTLPSNIRDWIRAIHHQPALRITEDGVWCRKWPSMGTIEWEDIDSLTLDSASSTASVLLRLKNEDKYFKRFRWSDNAALGVERFWGSFFSAGKSQGRPKTIMLCRLAVDQVTNALDPLLIVRGLPLVTVDPSAIREPSRPSSIKMRLSWKLAFFLCAIFGILIWDRLSSSSVTQTSSPTTQGSTQNLPGISSVGPGINAEQLFAAYRLALPTLMQALAGNLGRSKWLIEHCAISDVPGVSLSEVVKKLVPRWRVWKTFGSEATFESDLTSAYNRGYSSQKTCDGDADRYFARANYDQYLSMQRLSLSGPPTIDPANQ